MRTLSVREGLETLLSKEASVAGASDDQVQKFAMKTHTIWHIVILMVMIYYNKKA